MNWDAEIWAPCRLGEAFTLWDLGHVKTMYLHSIKADWMGHHGDATCTALPGDLLKTNPYGMRVGAGPRPWANCWTYEAKIKITPPVWCWDMQDDTIFGLDLKPKRNGNRRKVKLDCIEIHLGRPVYCMVVETADGNQRQIFDSIPVLDPYFAPIWPAAEEEPAQEPVANQVAETTETVTNAAETEQTTTERNEPTKNRNTDIIDAVVYSAGALIALEAPDFENRPPGHNWFYYYTF